MNQILQRECHLCGKVGDFRRCGKCKTAYYCSVECQSRDWENHKLECSEIKAQLPEKVAILAKGRKPLAYRNMLSGIIRDSVISKYGSATSVPNVWRV